MPIRHSSVLDVENAENTLSLTAIAILVKTPGRSPVKTRLAAGVGKRAATLLYRRAAAAVAESAEAAGIGPVYWAVAEKAALHDPVWSGLDRLEQGSGGLGARMAHVHATLVARHGKGLLLGADTPQIRPEDLQQAHRELTGGGPRIVLGPARDGGFWLFGANRPIPTERWSRTPYSSTKTRSRLKAALADLGGWHELDWLTDLDRSEDLRQVYQEQAYRCPETPAQRRLVRTLELIIHRMEPS